MSSYALGFSNPRFTSDIFDVIERNFSNYFDRSSEKSSVPKVDVRETPDAYILDMDLPGMTEKDVDVSFKDQVLSITAVKKEEKAEKDPEKGHKWLIRERVYSSFSRHFTLPNDIDSGKIAAEFSNGVLAIRIPRKEETKSAKIAITAK
ncbi:MAG: Hsp20/alpha crystallin family protein [Spirochaetaceae bacterium]|jgi:HSP20 family protein|nr:Hsp20/alpha crystallin family protein [Spirochaetaceae bacterium]